MPWYLGTGQQVRKKTNGAEDIIYSLILSAQNDPPLHIPGDAHAVVPI
jgi:hypothetical protein